MLPFFAVGQVGAVVLPRASDDFRYEAFLFIAGAEGFKQGKVYGDPLGVPTVGYGYALATKTKLGNQESWALKATLDADLSALTITLTQTQRDILNNIVGALNAGDSQFAKNLSDSLGNGSDRIRAITENEGHTLFNLELDRATNAVLERFKLFLKPIPGQALFDELQNSKEMVALASMAYNVPTTIGEKLARALANGDRAEAWYEIRYNTNSADQSSGIRRGIANRRYKESDRFALYNQRPMGDEDAKGAYRTFTRHKEGIKAYESTFSPPTDSSPIFTQLEGARLHLLAAYGQGVVFNWDNIWVGEDQTTAYYTSSDADVLTGSNQNDLMLGESGNDLLQGGGGEDVLHGNGGSDTLDGGEDSDWLYGGAGNDTFRYRPGSGSDHIFDSSTSPSGEGDGWGSILYDPDGMAQAVNTGLRKADDAENTWQSPDKTISFSLSGDVTITLPNGSIVVEQFNKDSKDLGIQLLTLPTDPENLESSPQWEATASGGVIQRNGTDQDDRQGTSGYKDFNGDSVNDLGEVRGLDNTVVQGGQGDDDIFGQGRLYGDDIADNLTGSDKIIGSGYLNGGLGGDVLLGKQERDHLVGGPPDNDNDGDDALQGDDGDDYLEGGNGRDVLAGGTGQDVLLGNKGDDHLVGDGTYTAQGRNWSATPISYMYDNTQLVGNIYIIPTEHFEGFSGEASVPGGQGDVMYGGLGKDSIRAGQGNDI
ncbi:MAG TPA: hypothetical protein VFB59_00060, partial [Candidatus Saccharimonadales bacterium]|nr:hypothetical protein [Candidatus Saccharimonadales bacterium]